MTLNEFIKEKKEEFDSYYPLKWDRVESMIVETTKATIEAVIINKRNTDNELELPDSISEVGYNWAVDDFTRRAKEWTGEEEK